MQTTINNRPVLNVIPTMGAATTIPITSAPISTASVIQPSQPAPNFKPGDDILVTTNQVKQQFDYYTNLLNKPEAKAEIAAFEKRQDDIEKRYLQGARACPVSQLEDLQDALGGLHPKDFKLALSKGFYNPRFMRALACVTDSIFFSEPVQKGAVSPSQRLKEWFRNLKQIGAPSVEGYAIRSDFGPDADNVAHDVFVIKVPQNPQTGDLLHELFVGWQLNKLRAYIPNFTYVFGGWKCAPPIIGTNKDVSSWCNNSNPSSSVNYIAYENVAPSKSIRQYIKDGCTFQQWLNKYMQVLYSLSEANKLFDYTHYDLHTENVLVRTIDSPLFSIPYQTEKGKTEYLATEDIATLIDYGFSHVKVDGENFGVYHAIFDSVFPQRGFYLHDAYRLLMWSLYDMKAAKNMAAFQGAAQILKFFNSAEPAEKLVDEQRPYYYFLPFSNKVAFLTLFDLTRYIRATVATPFITEQPTTQRVLGCDGTDACSSGSGLIKMIGMGSGPTAENFFEFYDLVTRLNAEGKTKEIQDVISKFDYHTARGKEINEYNQLISDLSSQLVNYQVLTVKGLPLQYFFNYSLLLDYKSGVSHIAYSYDIYQELSLHQKAIIYVAEVYKDNELLQLIDSKTNQINPLRAILEEMINLILDDIQYINGLGVENANMINLAIERNRDFLWWWRGLDNFTAVVSPINSK